MIVRPRPNAIALLFVIRGSVVPRIFPHLLAVGLFAAAVSALHELRWLSVPEFSLAPFTLLGVALSIFLGFRNNASYERWWEARKQWGAMVYEIRSLARFLEKAPDSLQKTATAQSRAARQKRVMSQFRRSRQ